MDREVPRLIASNQDSTSYRDYMHVKDRLCYHDSYQLKIANSYVKISAMFRRTAPAVQYVQIQSCNAPA